MPEPNGFEHAFTKDGRIRISHQGRVVSTVAGTAARKLGAKLESADESAKQHLLARATGNYKHGNERA